MAASRQNLRSQKLGLHANPARFGLTGREIELIFNDFEIAKDKLSSLPANERDIFFRT